MYACDLETSTFVHKAALDDTAGITAPSRHQGVALGTSPPRNHHRLAGVLLQIVEEALAHAREVSTA